VRRRQKHASEGHQNSEASGGWMEWM